METHLPQIQKTLKKNISPKRCMSSNLPSTRRFAHLPNSIRTTQSMSTVSRTMFQFEEDVEREQLSRACNQFAQAQASRHSSKVQAKLKELNSFEIDVVHSSKRPSICQDGGISTEIMMEPRDFTEIHRLAAIHGQQQAKREICRLYEEAEQKKKLMEAEQRDAFSIHGPFKQIPKGRVHQEHCRYGNECSKPSCKDIHPWNPNWAAHGCSGSTQLARLNESRYVYNMIKPECRRQLRSSTTKPAPHIASSTTPNNARSKELSSLKIQAAEAIDKILSQSGIPVHVRKLAHATLFPQLLGQTDEDGIPAHSGTIF
jgi:hypothetical protein